MNNICTIIISVSMGQMQRCAYLSTRLSKLWVMFEWEPFFRPLRALDVFYVRGQVFYSFNQVHLYSNLCHVFSCKSNLTTCKVVYFLYKSTKHSRVHVCQVNLSKCNWRHTERKKCFAEYWNEGPNKPRAVSFCVLSITIVATTTHQKHTWPHAYAENMRTFI